MKCEKCSSDITSWMVFRGFNSALRFSCSQCKTFYKINSPYLIPIAIGVFLLTIIIFLGAFLVGDRFGIKFLIQYLIVGIAIVCASEYLGNMYLLKNGNLELKETTTTPIITPTLFYIIAFVVLVFGFIMLDIPSDLPVKDIFSFTIYVIIIFLQIILMGMIFGVKSEVEKLKNEIKEQQRSTDDN